MGAMTTNLNTWEPLISTWGSLHFTIAPSHRYTLMNIYWHFHPIVCWSKCCLVYLLFLIICLDFNNFLSFTFLPCTWMCHVYVDMDYNRTWCASIHMYEWIHNILSDMNLCIYVCDMEASSTYTHHSLSVCLSLTHTLHSV